uniref:Uncharacterized protein n=1 Tax=Cucumis melo TaxID=3656 RepID=A0A9I9E939_CUCME
MACFQRTNYIEKATVERHILPTPCWKRVENLSPNALLSTLFLTSLSVSETYFPMYSMLLSMFLCVGSSPTSCSGGRPIFTFLKVFYTSSRLHESTSFFKPSRNANFFHAARPPLFLTRRLPSIILDTSSSFRPFSVLNMLLEATDCSRHTLVLEASTSIDFRYIDRISIGNHSENEKSSLAHNRKYQKCLVNHTVNNARSYKEVPLNWHVPKYTQSNDLVGTHLVFGEPKGTPRTNWSSVNPKEHLRQSGCK